mmetsp:Transcript_47496/g.137190  ORF Transcript_47496/g.137190 Transcript_47496/m.137190 type:complete len:245 (+) Transcript_47496:593-1327(+)
MTSRRESMSLKTRAICEACSSWKSSVRLLLPSGTVSEHTWISMRRCCLVWNQSCPSSYISRVWSLRSSSWIRLSSALVAMRVMAASQADWIRRAALSAFSSSRKRRRSLQPRHAAAMRVAAAARISASLGPGATSARAALPGSAGAASSSSVQKVPKLCATAEPPAPGAEPGLSAGGAGSARSEVAGESGGGLSGGRCCCRGPREPGSSDATLPCFGGPLGSSLTYRRSSAGAISRRSRLSAWS